MITIESCCSTQSTPPQNLWEVTTTLLGTGIEDMAGVSQAIINEFGANARILDFTDLQAYHNIHGNLDPLPRQPGQEHYYAGVTKNGVFWEDTSGGRRRNYFVSEDGSLHQSSFRVYGSIGPRQGLHNGNLIDLGTWYGAREYYVKFV